MNTILHLGLGSFHRAHQAVYLNRLIDSGDTGWQIVAGNIRPDGAAVIAALQAQGGAYTVETVTPQGDRRYERIRAIREVASLPRLVEVGADESTRIVSFTVTEAGYFLDAAGRLDLSGTDPGQTIYAAVAAILRRRTSPVTLLNCDNLRSNGARFRSGLLQYLAGDSQLARWAEANTTCPSAMVDRITPRPPADLAARVRAATGFDDAAPVMAESFIQWVIEDDFIAGRPAWEGVGVEMVESVHAHEEAKIRILNASHSCIAWAGTLRGLEAIHEGTAVPEIRRMAHDYVTDDVIPCLTADHPSPIDLAAYRDVVLDRFGNPYVRDTNQRVAMDGWSKIPGFIAPTLRECLARGASIASTAVLPALFFAFLGRWHRSALPYTYEDGVMDPAAAHAVFAQPDPLAAYCRDPVLWGDLAGSEALHAAVAAAHRRVQQFEGTAS